jgi:hypothetical protein
LGCTDVSHGWFDCFKLYGVAYLPPGYFQYSGENMFTRGGEARQAIYPGYLRDQAWLLPCQFQSDPNAHDPQPLGRQRPGFSVEEFDKLYRKSTWIMAAVDQAW